MKHFALGILASCVLLAACGGSNSGLVVSPTPPPPPAAPFPLTTNASFQTITGTLAYNGEAREPSSSSGPADAALSRLETTGRSAAVTFGYDAGTGTYTIQGAGGSATFTAADQTPATDYRQVYSVANGSVSDAIALYGNVKAGGTASAPVALSYTSYGLWIHADGATRQTTNTYFLYGQPTGATMPTTGTASYQMTVAGRTLATTIAPSTISSLTGSATMNANFATGAVDTVLSIAGGTFNGNGTIATDQFSGQFTSSDPTFVGGGFMGGFFGPGAREAGYTFHINKYNPDPYAGATIAAMNTYITGVAVGPKK